MFDLGPSNDFMGRFNRPSVGGQNQGMGGQNRPSMGGGGFSRRSFTNFTNPMGGSNFPQSGGGVTRGTGSGLPPGAMTGNSRGGFPWGPSQIPSAPQYNGGMNGGMMGGNRPSYNPPILGPRMTVPGGGMAAGMYGGGATTGMGMYGQGGFGGNPMVGGYSGMRGYSNPPMQMPQYGGGPEGVAIDGMWGRYPMSNPMSPNYNPNIRY